MEKIHIEKYKFCPSRQNAMTASEDIFIFPMMEDIFSDVYINPDNVCALIMSGGNREREFRGFS